LRGRAQPSVSDWEGTGEDDGPAFDGLAHPDTLRDIADEQDFAEILQAVQSAWSEGNIALIRAHVTPEMADHYNDALAQNARNGIESRVERVEDVRVERLRDWEEDGLKFATARVRWKALDYLIDAAKTPDEPGYVIDGSPDEPVDCEETWTFVKAGDGAWVLTDVEPAA
jgi:predicted lipid-binding transport protein (Tim44 family)